VSMSEFLENLKAFVRSKRALEETNAALRERLSLLDDLRAHLRDAEKQRDYYAELLLTRAGYETETAKQSRAETKSLAQSAITNWKARKRALESRSSEEAQRIKEHWARKIAKEESKDNGTSEAKE